MAFADLTPDCGRCPIRARHFDGPEELAGHARLAAVVARRQWRDRQTLFVEGHQGEHVFFVRSGAVRLTRLQPDGAEVLIDFVGAGGVVGLESIFSGENDVTATACGVVACCTASASDVRGLLPTTPGLAVALLRISHADVGGLRTRFADVTSAPAEQRVARFLLGTLPVWQAQVPGFTQMDMARALGLTPETLCRVLAQFRRRQWVHGQAHSLTVLDRERLQQLSAGAAQHG
ncbi:MAG: Crp/Fnr family transcriptional regulator [Deltaproteobacteria bacterium]